MEINYKDIIDNWLKMAETHRRVLAFMINELINTGESFELSSEGASSALRRLMEKGGQETEKDGWVVVQKLQAADSSRQRLEQLAGIVRAMMEEQEALAETLAKMGIVVEEFKPDIDRLSAYITLSDTRNRLRESITGEVAEKRGVCLASGEVDLF